jgi:hypothetical protein
VSDEGVLRDPAEADLNALLARTRRTADLCERLAGEAGAELAAGLEELARRHRQHADALEAQVRALGALPMDVDPDAETVEQMLARARAALAGLAGRDADRARARDALRAEEELALDLDAAAAHTLPPAGRTALAELRETLEAGRARLTRHAGEDGAGGAGPGAGGS